MTLLRKEKEESELEFWLTWKGKRTAQREKKWQMALDLFDVRDKDMGVVLEIGTGPECGLLPNLKAKRKIGLDPLYREYEAHGLLWHFSDIELIVGLIEHAKPSDFPVSFDNVFTIGTLDHGESCFRSLRNIANLLKPSGKLYLHVHLRKPGEGDAVHNALQFEDYAVEARIAGLKEIWRVVYPGDPLSQKGSHDSRLQTLVACLERR